MKKHLFGIVGLVTVLAVGYFLHSGNSQSKEIQEGIAEKIIRFHVIADSDLPQAQEVKLQVKDAVVKSMEPMLKDVESVQEAREMIQVHMNEIEEVARESLEAQGSTNEVKAELTHCYFPVKSYGEYTFPDGEYEALRITIGEGEGKNWWCVMYPRLCFVDSLYSVVPQESKKELKNQLTDEEYKAILDGEKQVKIKWKFLEWLR